MATARGCWPRSGGAKSQNRQRETIVDRSIATVLFGSKREVELLHLVRAPSQKGSIRDRPSGRASLTLTFLTTPEGVLKIAEALTESTSSRMVGKQKTENLIR